MASYFLDRVSEELMRKIKAMCALRGMSIKSLIVSLLEKELEKHENVQ